MPVWRLSLRCIPRYPRPAPSFASPRCPRHALCGQWRRVQCASVCGRSRRVGCLLSGRTRRTRPAGVCVVLSSVVGGSRSRVWRVSRVCACLSSPCPCRAMPLSPRMVGESVITRSFSKNDFPLRNFAKFAFIHHLPPLHINRASSMWCHSLVRIIAAAASISALYTAARLVRRRLGES